MLMDTRESLFTNLIVRVPHDEDVKDRWGRHSVQSRRLLKPTRRDTSSLSVVDATLNERKEVDDGRPPQRLHQPQT